jgi:hypothetical protein
VLAGGMSRSTIEYFTRIERTELKEAARKQSSRNYRQK